MSIPTYDELMLPLLQFSGDGKEHHIREAVAAIANYLQLSEEQRAELLPNGKKYKFDDRVQWANTYLKKAGLLESTGWGKFRITARGLDALGQNLSRIDKNYLLQFAEFAEWIISSRRERIADTTDSGYMESQQTPKELMHGAYEGLRKELAGELIDTILLSSPAFFEQLVIDLLLAMGYGGALEQAGRTIGRTGDGGLDGYIQEDKLGLDIIYVQAKRWNQESVVGRPAVQGFVGSLMGAGATKGVFITTSRFSQEAADYAGSVKNLKIILIDGQQLAQLMIDHNVGVAPEATYVVKKIDRDYFNIV